MANRKPGFWCGSEWYQFPTYRKLLKALPEFIRSTSNNEIHVYRSRRGEWGEWFEIFVLRNGKLHKIKEGWN